MSIHPAYLPGGETYQEALTVYQHAQSADYPDEAIRQEALEAARQRLEQARNSFRKQPSKDKKDEAKIPPSIDLVAVTDPVTNQPLFLKTWIKEHPNPKLTDEERANMHTLYERRYKGAASGLAVSRNIIAALLTA